MRWLGGLLVALLLAGAALVLTSDGRAGNDRAGDGREGDGRAGEDKAGESRAGVASDGVGLVDPATGRWLLRDAAGTTATFFYGNPGDVPFLGDWDCDGEATPGLYRQADGFAYLRNSNSQGIADIRFFFGDPGDVPLPGDFDGDGCDTLAVYRPATQQVFVVDRLGDGSGGLGAADHSFVFGDPGDQPVAGDWDGDGDDEIGLHRPTTGFFYWRATATSGIADGQIFFGDPADRFVAGDWTGTGRDAPAVFRPGDHTFYFRHTLSQGVADAEVSLGLGGRPVAGPFALAASGPVPAGRPACAFFPPDNPWNTDVSALPVHPDSDVLIDAIGRDGNLHPDFGTFYEGAPIGIPYVVVGSGQPRVPVRFTYADESDPGPYPIPAEAPIEGGAQADGDRHVLVLDDHACILYELFDAHPRPDGSWDAGSGAVFDLRSNALRPDFWTSADAAGLPILPGLVRYDEVVEDGRIDHALRFTVRRTRRAFIHPATHFASTSADPGLPPMGMRLRLRASYDCSGLSDEAQVVCAALRRYGMFVADNGSDWFLTGTHDPRWDDDALGDLKSIPGSAFEVVDTGEPVITG